jgi:hypothetical protein
MNLSKEDNDLLNKKSFKAQLHQFLENAAHEIAETKEAGMIIIKHQVYKEKLTKEEKRFIKEQTWDVLKALGIVVPFALLPGASVLIPIIVVAARKKGIEILPSSFVEPVTKPDEKSFNNKNGEA